METTQLTFKHVSFGSDDYQKMVGLRNAVLRIPMGRVLLPEELARDEHYTQMAVFNAGNEVVATVLLSRESDTLARIRQVTVRADMQGQGIGMKLIAYAEAEAIAQNFSEIMLYARNSAIHFYERLGYVAEGDYFEEVGVPHIIMRKKL